jgi:2-oxo-4-hydroxy-4-carboxy-5-ureidoimidazoline decarboxylase
VTLDELNALPPDRAADALRACCGASRWVNAMLARRPFGSLDDILRAADESWAALGPDDWHEAFAHHPRIGEQRSASRSARGATWSAGEQSNVSTAAIRLRDELAAVNREYETRFGFIYLVSAAGKTAEQLLAIAHSRLQNEPAAELRIAAGEQHKITHLRLARLLSEPS